MSIAALDAVPIIACLELGVAHVLSKIIMSISYNINYNC